jgi:hypothetical protein
VSWVTLAGGHATVAVTVDVAALRALVEAGDVHTDDEYILEVVGRATQTLLWSAVPLECFIFSPSMVLDANEEMTSMIPASGASPSPFVPIASPPSPSPRVAAAAAGDADCQARGLRSQSGGDAQGASSAGGSEAPAVRG